MKCIHVDKYDQGWKVGFGYWDDRPYGQHGFEIYLGRRILCFWRDEED